MTLVGFFLLTLGGKSDVHKLRYHRILQKRAKFIVNNIPGSSFVYRNTPHEDFENPSIIVCNHQSHIDLMGVIMLSPKLIILTNDWVWRNPFYGIIIRYADYFPVSEEDKMRGNIEEMIKKGYSVVIFPEGTRSEDCHIQRFHKGAFYLAEQLKLDIIPIFIDGFGELLPKHSYSLHPAKLLVEVLPRIYSSEIAKIGYRETTKKVREIYLNKYSLNNLNSGNCETLKV